MRIRAKKSLGQHFLSSRAYLRAIADAAGVASKDVVLEIGPGQGSLTQEILSRGARVVAVEKDRRLIPFLQEKFKREIATGALTLIEKDALAFDPVCADLHDGGYKVVANIPYYITGALFEKFLGYPPRPSAMALLVQKEVAQRIARSEKESILSLSVKAYGTPRYVKTVPSGAFSPPPRVDSAILSVEGVSSGNFKDAEHERRFFDILHAGFAHKRKLLARNLEPVVGKQTREKLLAAGAAANARAESVSLAQWLTLSA